MQDIVKAAMAKWPNVPHCYGWLGLDARGNWYLRDDAAQAAGPFPGLLADPAVDPARALASKGSRLEHSKLIDFIASNYETDLAAKDGRWYFQNGPQRVYVELQATPWVWRVRCGEEGQIEVSSHTGQAAQAVSVLVDEHGWVYLNAELAGQAAFGLVHSQDVGEVAKAIELGRYSTEEVRSSDLPKRFGYVLSPQALHGGKK
jgi:Protein of unknown function (DUF2946)